MAVLKLLKKLFVLGLALCGFLLAMLFLVPDGNTFGLGTVNKHDRLDAAPGPKIVFVGGSGLAYGLDSATFDRNFKYWPVNMGLSAWIGLRFPLDEIVPSLKRGDVVVLVPEHENYLVHNHFDAIYGDTGEILLLVKNRPASMATVHPWWRKFELVGRVPMAVHYKGLRILQDLGRLSRGEAVDAPIESIESIEGINAYGDLVSHIGVEWTEPRTPGLELSKHKMDPRVLPAIREYREQLKALGVSFFMFPPPTPEERYAEHKATIQTIYAEVEKIMPGVLVAPQESFLFPDSCFFDDVHHLNGRCRIPRTERMVEALRPHLPKDMLR